jgi:hypothetical protein
MTDTKRILTFIVAIALPLFPLNGQDNADFPNLQSLLPLRAVQVDVMALRYPVRFEELSARMQKAIASHREWITQYVKDNADAGPLPYHENFGMSSEEYAEYLALGKKATLEKTASVSLMVKQTKDGVQLRFDDTANALQPIEIDPLKQTVDVPLAKMTSPAKRNSGSEGGLLGPHKSYTWSAREGTPESGTWQSVEFTLGIVIANGREFIQYKVHKLVNQKPAIHFETILFFDPPK